MTTSSTGFTALEAFHRSGTGEARREAFRSLVATVWEDGTRTAEAEALAPVLVRELTAGETDHREFNGHHAILLGLLLEAARPQAEAEQDGPDPVAAAASAGLDGYLAALSGAGEDEPLTLALVYLLAHLTEEREQILAAAEARGLSEDDLSRLTRCLAPCDPDDEIGVLRLGRCFPSPAAWTVSDDELRAIGGWVQWVDLAPHLPMMWQGETNTLLGYSGGKALWSVEHGAIAETAEHVVENDVVDAVPVATDGGADALGRHLPILRCTACHASLSAESDALACTGCEASYPLKDGFVDVVGGEDEREDPLMARFHEKWLRPAFMRLIGGNWAGEVSFADENRWVTEFMRPADGPIVDLGPGAGITTKTLAEKYGVERLIAVDASATMLVRLGRRVPGTASVRASATDMPFQDASVGALNCWNMLHYFEDKTAALHEIGRILQPGGSFTLMDLIPEPDHVARYFQGRMGETVIRKLFGPEEIGAWLGKAGMTIQDIYLPGGNFMVLRAVRTDEPLPPLEQAGMPRPDEVLLRGLDVFQAVVSRLTKKDWKRKSPCDGWSALDVLGHLGHCMDFSLEVLNGTVPPWEPATPPGAMVEGDPVAWWNGFADRLRAFVAENDLSQEVDNPTGKTTVNAGLSFPALDLFVHGWDIAKSAGLDLEIPSDVIAFAHAVIDPLPYERVRGPRHYGDPLPVSDDATESDKFLAYVGRDAAWTASK